MFIKLFIASCLLTIINSWDYEKEGPDFWNNFIRDDLESCKLNSQSPINIEQSSAKYDSNLGNFVFSNYNTTLTWTAEKEEHSIKISTTSDSAPAIEGSDFFEQFSLLSFHFHWGHNIYQGSEHILDGEKFPLEVHLVHRVKPNGSIAVLGFLFEISPSDNQDLKPLVDVSDIKTIGEKRTFQYALNSMIPDATTLNSNGYFRYSGSLTTPPCSEGLIWTVFKQKIKISKAQVEKFYESGVKMNFRDVQPLNGRTITTNINNSAKPYFFNNWLLAISSVLLLLKFD